VKAVSVNNERVFTCPGREIRDEPTEGALVRAVLVVLTGRRVQRAWRDVILGVTSHDGAWGMPFGALVRRG